MSKSLMILGGSGFFGKSFLDAYLQKKLDKFKISKLILISRNNNTIKKISKTSKKKIIIIDKDLSNTKKLPFANYVIHAAEYVNPEKIIRNYKKGLDLKLLNNVFNILSSESFIKSKILYISSGAVYAERSIFKKKISEKGLLHIIKNRQLKSSKEIYINNKLIGEQITRELSKKHNIKTSICRCFTLIGKYIPLNKQYVIGNFMFSILKRKPLKIFEKSSKKVFRSYMHVEDLVNWLMTILKKSKYTTPVYNVGSDRPISIWSLGKCLSKDYDLKFIYPKQNNKNFDYYIPNIQKAKKDFALKNKFDFQKSVKYTLKNLNYSK